MRTAPADDAERLIQPAAALEPDEQAMPNNLVTGQRGQCNRSSMQLAQVLRDGELAPQLHDTFSGRQLTTAEWVYRVHATITHCA